MTQIDIISGFLGAGKTTLIKKLIKEAFAGQKLVLIENEFGEIGIDGGFLQEAGIQITEMNSGCICCSLVGDFSKALGEVMERFHPDRILIEPSGVGKLSDVDAAVRKLKRDDWQPGSKITVADAVRAKMYLKNFGEFYKDQVEAADLIVLSRTQNMDGAKLEACLQLLREIHPDAAIVTTPWDQLDGKQIMAAAREKDNWQQALLAHEHDEDHDHEHDEDCDCEECREHHHHHDHDHDEHDHDHDHDHEHHHHHDDDDDDEHEHEHEHEHHHDHAHHHHHHDGEHDADEVFTSWGRETARKFTAEELEKILTALNEEEKYGIVLRSKGIVPAADGTWLHFDYVPGEQSVRTGPAEVTGRLVVIGSELQEDALGALVGGI
jgi:G3E family GTPase